MLTMIIYSATTNARVLIGNVKEFLWKGMKVRFIQYGLGEIFSWRNVINLLF